MGGGGDCSGASSSSSSSFSPLQEEEVLLDQNLDDLLQFSSPNNNTQSDDMGVKEGEGLDFCLGSSGSLSSYDLEILKMRRFKAYQQIMENYNNLEDQIGGLKEAKDKIISYKPGAWIEKVAGLEVSDYDIPKTTTLTLIGPKGSGKSSLVNRISRAIGENQFASERAQVSYNSSVGDGTYFLHEYMVPRGSTSFCLYDTRSLSEDSCDNSEMLKNWMTNGVHHGQLVIRESDASSVKEKLNHKARGSGWFYGVRRRVGFFVFVVNGLAVLKSMEDEDNKKYTDMLAKTFSCPYLSFKDDKPVIVITHGDFLSHSNRARGRVHLGELLGIPPDTQIFDIPDNCDPSTELAIADMLRYSLERADRNLPHKLKVPGIFIFIIMMCVLCICLFYKWKVIILSKDKIVRNGEHYFSYSSDFLKAMRYWMFKREAHRNWHTMRHLW